MSVTKNTKQPSQYHTWAASELTDGDVIGCTESLGKPASSIMIESPDGTTIIKLNVCQKIYRRQDVNNSWVPNAGFYTQPIEVDELEDTSTAKDRIEVMAGTVLEFDKFPVSDIKLIQKAASTRITITR
jgi:hypothetical protein